MFDLPHEARTEQKWEIIEITKSAEIAAKSGKAIKKSFLFLKNFFQRRLFMICFIFSLFPFIRERFCAYIAAYMEYKHISPIKVFYKSP